MRGLFVTHTMKKVIGLLFGIIILNSSCETQYSTDELKNNFSKEQISDLNTIIDFFKESVCLNPDFKICFENTKHDSLLISGVGIWTKIDFNEQLKLYDRISESTFNEIWMYCESTYYPSKTKAKSLCANSTGKYQKYLAELGIKKPRIAKYAEGIQGAGVYLGLDIHYQGVLKDKETFDLNDPNIQLILAIHYLSVNDDAKRNKDLMELPEEPNF